MSAFDHLAFVPLQRGARDTNPSGPVHRLQGWLTLHGCYPGKVDGDFGLKTELALAEFRQRLGPLATFGDPLSSPTWAHLTAPLARAMAPLERWRPPTGALGQTVENMPRKPSLGDAVAACARQWLAQSVGGVPLRELPGNSGPVVEACTRWLAERDRLPCFCGHDHFCHSGSCMTEGCGCRSYAPDWRLAWCAGWVSTVLRQASESLGVPMPIRGSLSCDVLARQAQANEDPARGGFYRGDWAPNLRLVKPGAIFLVRGAKPGDWTHCGVVLEVQRHMSGSWLVTAEANTTEGGSRNGDRIRERRRGWANKRSMPDCDGLDFIYWGRS